jgi:hypothetical protein
MEPVKKSNIEVITAVFIVFSEMIVGGVIVE